MQYRPRLLLIMYQLADSQERITGLLQHKNNYSYSKIINDTVENEN